MQLHAEIKFNIQDKKIEDDQGGADFEAACADLNIPPRGILC